MEAPEVLRAEQLARSFFYPSGLLPLFQPSAKNGLWHKELSAQLPAKSVGRTVGLITPQAKLPQVSNGHKQRSLVPVNQPHFASSFFGVVFLTVP